MPELNPQGLTAQQMGQAAVDNAQRDVIQRAVNNPGTLVQGPQTGMTSASGNMAPTPTNFQAYTQPNGGGSIPLVSSSANPNVLTSADADSFVSRAQSRIQPETNVEYGTSTPRTVPGPSFYDQYGNADPIGVSARRIYGIQEEKINKAYKPQEEQTAANLRNETLTSNASRFQTGQAGTEYGRMVMQDLADQHQRELDTLAMQKQQALNNAWDATLRGQVGVFVQQQAEAERLQQAAQQKKSDFYREQQEMIQLQKMDTETGGAIYNLVKTGIQPSDKQLELLDGMRGYAKGTSRMLYEATSTDMARTKAKNDIEAKNLAVDSAKKISDYLDSRPIGEPVEIGDMIYYGTGKGRLKTGVEVDKVTGQGLYYEYDPDTGRTITTPMGTVGFADPNWTLEKDDDGNLWRVSVDTNQTELINVPGQSQSAPRSTGGTTRRIPMTPGSVQKTLNAVMPEGTTPPPRPGGNPANAGQCGSYWGWCTQIQDMPNDFDSFGGKLRYLSNKPRVASEDIRPGLTFLMKGYGTTGHIGFTADIVYDPKTQEVSGFMADESNAVPPGGEKVSYSRFVSINDPRIVGLFDVPTPNKPQSGSDSIYTSYASGNVPQQSGFGRFGGSKTSDPYLSPSEAATLRVPYGTTRSQAARMNITPTSGGSDSDKPLSATEIKAYGLDPSDPKNVNLTRSQVGARLSESQAAKELKVPTFDEFALNFEREAAKNTNIANIDPAQMRSLYDRTVGTTPSYMDAATNLAYKFAGDKKGPAFVTDVQKAIESGDYARAQDKLKKAALDTVDATTGQQVRGRDNSLRALENIEMDLKTYVSKYGDTGIFTGKEEEILGKIGKVSNSEQKKIATKINAAIADYRRAISGAAFTESEKAEYASMFPSILNGSELNQANIDAMKEVLGNANESFYRQQIGNENYDVIFRK